MAYKNAVPKPRIPTTPASTGEGTPLPAPTNEHAGTFSDDGSGEHTLQTQAVVFNCVIKMYEPPWILPDGSSAKYPVPPLPSGQLVANAFIASQVFRYWGKRISVGSYTP